MDRLEPRAKRDSGKVETIISRQLRGLCRLHLLVLDQHVDHLDRESGGENDHEDAIEGSCCRVNHDLGARVPDSELATDWETSKLERKIVCRLWVGRSFSRSFVFFVDPVRITRD